MKSRRPVLASIAALSVLATGGSALGACPAGLNPVQTAQLIFGRDKGETLGVSEDDWRRFLDREVTPRFPDGFTVEDASGQWRGRGGRLVREPSKVLMIVLTGGPDPAGKLEAIRKAYRARFHQQAVLLIEEAGCAGF